MHELGMKKGLKHLLGGSITGRCLNFVFNIGLTRILGASNLGLFGLILATSQTFEITTRVGVDYGMQCSLTERETENQLSTIEENIIVSSAMRWIEITTVFFGVFLIVWLIPVEGLLPKELTISRNFAAIIMLLICCIESLGGLAWDILLVAGKTKLVALKTGLFVPCKLGLALTGAWVWGLKGCLIAYTIVCVGQTIWLRKTIGLRWSDKKSKQPIDWRKILWMVQAGLPLYATNAISALVFLPLLGNLAADANLEDVGYIRVGQIVVQIFSLLPGALAPLLFIKLRQTKDSDIAHNHSEVSLLFIWLAGIFMLLTYTAIDKTIVLVFFGEDFLPALSATRLLALVAILDAISQVLHTSLLARAETRLFSITQNLSAIAAGVLGWLLIPVLGIAGFLAAKLVYSWLPVMVYITDAWGRLKNKRIVSTLLVMTAITTHLCWGEKTLNAYLWVACTIFIAILAAKLAAKSNIFFINP